jgi:hypothetical protein
METHDLTTKMMAKIPKIARNCESWASEIQSAFLARKGERGMKYTDHFLTGVPFTSAVNGSI